MVPCLKNWITAAAFAVTALSANAFAADDLNGWRTTAAKKIIKNMTYPRSAVQNEQEGRALVKITVSSDGSIEDYQVLQQSGEAVLDREIPKILKRTGSFPQLPKTEQSITFVVPLIWTLS